MASKEVQGWQMEKPQSPSTPPCTRCGKQPCFITSILDPKCGPYFPNVPVRMR